MIRNHFYVLILILLSGCASAPSIAPQIPKVWSQKPEERGMLPVGRVVTIERWHGPSFETKRSDGAEITRGLVGASVVIPAAILLAPVMLGAHAAGVDMVHERTDEKTGNVYRHVVRLSGTSDEVIRDEYYSYKVGDCVAVRSKPVLLVPAFPDQCE